nr:uncharacterized protein LOC109150412 [Ipomoea batatas]
MVFNSTREFKWAVEYHDALRHKDVKFKKNEARRVRVVCRHNNTCKWSIFGSKSNPNCPFTIKTYNQVHSCGNQDENKVVTSGFLAKFFKDDFRVNTDWGRGPFQEHVKAKFNCQLTINQAYLAKKKAMKQIDGQDSEQFKLLNDYCEELRKSNPGTIVKMKLDSEFIVNGRPRFVRPYICFGACKEGFISGCKPIIGLDGCHLKGSQKGGQLLSAIGLDGDNSIFPVAFAIVEGELKDSWCWFLKLLDNDLNLSNNPSAWTIIFDKQKGLLPPVEELFPGLEHRFCARHMHANFLKDGFTGHALKMQFWAVCKANTKAEYHDRMEEIKTLNVKAFEWLSARDPKHYSIRKKGDLPELYVHQCYSVEQYLRAYGPAILPIRAEELWHKTELPPPLPPKYMAQLGRPKKKRREKLIQLLKNLIRQSLERKVQQPHSHVLQQTVSDQVKENHEVQGQFEDVVVETQVPDFVLNEMEEMSSQPSQATGGENVIRTVSDFISAAAANEPTSTRKKYITVGGIKYSYSEAYLLRK